MIAYVLRRVALGKPALYLVDPLVAADPSGWGLLARAVRFPSLEAVGAAQDRLRADLIMAEIEAVDMPDY